MASPLVGDGSANQPALDDRRGLVCTVLVDRGDRLGQALGRNIDAQGAVGEAERQCGPRLSLARGEPGDLGARSSHRPRFVA